MKAPQRLAHLRTDAVGRPVPFVNVWGLGDQVERWSIRFDRNIGKVAAYYADVDEGEPNFTRQSIQRQRECVVNGLCQVCARPVPWPQRILVVSSVSTATIDLNGRHTVVVTEPWLCLPCARFAVTYCPALIRRASAEDLRIVPVTSPDQCQFVMSDGWIDGPLEAATKRDTVAMWAKINLLTSVAGNVRTP